MKKPRLTSPAVVVAGLAVLILVTGVYQASTPVMDSSGNLLTAEIVFDPTDPSVQGVALINAGPTGTTVETILSTFDPILDQDPDLALNPYDGEPVIVWSRQEDGNDLELAMVRRIRGDWGPVDILTNSTTSDIEPRVIVDLLEEAHIVWYPVGIGGPVYLQSFNVRNGHNVGPPAMPLESRQGRLLKRSIDGSDEVGGGDDPGLIGGLTAPASNLPCATNPAAAPEHGVLLACGKPAAYQLSSCKLVAGAYDSANSRWLQSSTSLASVSLNGTSVRQIAQSMANARCN